MARENLVSKKIYKKHLAFYRHINDSWIFIDLVRPYLKKRGKRLIESPSNAKKPYQTPKKGGWVTNKRRDKYIGEIYKKQHNRGFYETNIVSIVSHFEAFIQDCVSIAACAYPDKLKLLSYKTGVPVDLLLENENREDLIQRFVALKCDQLMFSKPKDYLERASKVLSIVLERESISAFIEIKATRDIIVHGGGIASKVYLEKAGNQARAGLGDELPIDRNYFINVVRNLKKISGEIQRKTEDKYK